MKKFFKNNLGFTLLEVTITAGLVGMVGLIAYTSLEKSQTIVNSSLTTSEATFLKNQVIVTMGNPESCVANFKNQLVTRTGIPQLIRKQRDPGPPPVMYDMKIVEIGKSYGEGGRRTIKVTNIETLPTANNPNGMSIRVSYELLATQKQISSKKTDNFVVDIFIGKDPAGTSVLSCFADIAGMIRNAIANSCMGNGVVYNGAAGTYGQCVHKFLKITDTGGTTLTTGCPANQFLSQVTTTAGTTAGATTNAGNITFVCKTYSTAAPSCPANNFMKGIDVDGKPICTTLDALIDSLPDGWVISTTATGYQAINLNCPVDQVLRRVTSSGTPVCVPKVISANCPVGQYITNIDNNGNPTCTTFPKLAAGCPAGQYLRQVNADGSVPVGGCAPMTLPAANCGENSDNVMYYIDTNGNVACTPNN